MADQLSHYYSITAASDFLDLSKNVIRFWEKQFSMIKPMRNNTGRRYYRAVDIELLKAIKYLVYEQGYSIKGLNKLIKDYSIEQVIDLADEFRHNAMQVPDSLQIEKPMIAIDNAPTANNINAQAIISYIDQVLALDEQYGSPSS